MARSRDRAADELRPVDIQPGFVRTATGSALISCGETRVICTASVQESVPKWIRAAGSGWVTAEYGMLPASTGDRKPRDAARGRPDGRSIEIQRLIGRSLRGVVDFAALGERTVYVDCDVLQADGGTRCASITGGYVALELALRRLVEEGRLEAVPLTGSVAAVSCGIVDGTPLLDLDYPEDSSAEVDANVVMTGDGGLVEVQATAERTPLSRAHLDELLGARPDRHRGPAGRSGRGGRRVTPGPLVLGTPQRAQGARVRPPPGRRRRRAAARGHRSPEETGEDLRRERADQGARRVAATGRPAVADDSGIGAEALGWRPGVFSARYAGEDATDEDNLRRSRPRSRPAAGCATRASSR